MNSHMRSQVVVPAESLVAHRTAVGLLSGVDQPVAMQMLDPAKRPIAGFAFVVLFLRVSSNVLGQLALAHPFAALRTAGRFRIGRFNVFGEHRSDEETGGILSVVGGAGRMSRCGDDYEGIRREFVFVLSGRVHWFNGCGVRGTHGC